MQKLIFLIVFLSLSFTLFAQNRKILTPDGKLHSINEVKRVKQFNKVGPQTKKINPINSINGTIDTLGFPGPWDSNFDFFGQDWMLQWFQAPADLIIKKVGFACYENNDNMVVEVKLVKVSWTVEELLNADVLQRGYYEALGNGYNDITSFLDNPDRTGGWTSIQPGDTEPFSEDIWSFDGTGFQITPVGNPIEPTYQWVDLSILEEPEILQGEIFGIAIKHTGTDMDQNRIGFWASLDGPTGWRFYANGRSNPGVDYGWWTTEYTLDFTAEVEFIYGPHPPRFHEFTQIPSGIDTGPFTIDAIITFATGFDSAILQWSINGGTDWNNVTMINTGGDDYTGDIPAQSPNTNVDYRLVATDINSNSTTQNALPFYVFGPTSSNLLVFNGYTTNTGYPQAYYFGYDVFIGYNTIEWDHDVWAYGSLSLLTSIINDYNNIIEITTTGPGSIDTSVIRDWLAGDPNRNYMLAGDEWLGSISGWPAELDHFAGEFIFDVLGVNKEYNDIGEPSLRNPVFAQTGTLLGGPLFDKWTQVSADSNWTSDIMYSPDFEILVSNWLDGVDFEGDVEVDLKGTSLRASDSLTVHNIAGHRTLPAGNKIAFFAYDPISLNSGPDPDAGEEYYWYGFSESAPQVQVLNWFGIATGVSEVGGVIPEEYTISQNYPNPFNPSTTINFSVPKHSKVVLKVYDILGSEVAILVDGFKNTGNYEVNFDASKLASGMYIYRLTAGNFTTSKKMMLLK